MSKFNYYGHCKPSVCSVTFEYTKRQGGQFTCNTRTMRVPTELNLFDEIQVQTWLEHCEWFAHLPSGFRPDYSKPDKASKFKYEPLNYSNVNILSIDFDKVWD